MKTKTITLGDKSFDLPPCPLIVLAELQEEGIETKDVNPSSPEGVRKLARFIHGALKRTYPDVTFEDVLYNIDGHNVQEVTQAFAYTNTLEKAESPSGEVSAG